MILNLINIFLTGLSFGGIGNVIQFIINEGFISRPYQTNKFAETHQIWKYVWNMSDIWQVHSYNLMFKICRTYVSNSERKYDHLSNIY